MTQKLQNFFWNGTLKKLCFVLGVLCMLLFFLGGPFFTWLDNGSINVAIFFSMFVFLLASFFLPNKNKKKHRYPASAVKEGSDKYLDQKTDEFSSEEREALLKESWMAQAEKYNRTRKV